jgi:hypothetical protein
MEQRNRLYLVLCLVFVLIGSVSVAVVRATDDKTLASTTTVTSTSFVTVQNTNLATSTVTSSVTVSASPQTSTQTLYLTQTRDPILKESLGVNSSQTLSSIMVGGQNGTWFEQGQYPRLSIISLEDFASAQLTPIPSEQEGTVWSGAWNGSRWFVSGWGENNSISFPPNPYLNLYYGNGSRVADENSINSTAESEWNGGDIFAASSNGTHWFVSGLGSGILSSYSSLLTNHFSAGLYDGKYFTDLSPGLPQQWDGILYAKEYNVSEWLVGGGW